MRFSGYYPKPGLSTRKKRFARGPVSLQFLRASGKIISRKITPPGRGLFCFFLDEVVRGGMLPGMLPEDKTIQKEDINYQTSFPYIPEKAVLNYIKPTW